MQPRDGYSNKSLLSPPRPDEVARLAQLSRRLNPEALSEGNHAAPYRSLRRRLSPRVIEELVARYTSGEKILALSREFGISDSGLRQLLLAERVSLRGHAITVEDAALTRAGYPRRCRQVKMRRLGTISYPQTDDRDPGVTVRRQGH